MSLFVTLQRSHTPVFTCPPPMLTASPECCSLFLWDARDRSSRRASTCDCFHSDDAAATAAALWRHRAGSQEAARQFEPRTERECVWERESERERVCVYVCVDTGLSGYGTQASVLQSRFRFGEKIKENTDEEEEGGKEKKKVAAFGAQWNFKMENSSSNSRFRSAMFNHGESSHPTLNAEMLVYFLNRTYLRKNK